MPNAQAFLPTPQANQTETKPAKRALGRGLAELLPVGGGASNGADIGPGQEVPIISLHPNPRQPRTRFDETALSELADSIRNNGVLQPILVRPRLAGGYEIVAGERRYRASIKVGLKQVPVVVRNLNDEEALALGLIENLVRQDLGPMETARAYQRLMEEYHWTQEEMGRRVGKSRPAVANALRLLRLPEAVQQSLERGELSEGHARTLLGDDRGVGQDDTFKERQMRVWRLIVDKGLSVREVEKMMREEKALASRLGDGRTGGEPGSLRGREDERQARGDEADLRHLEDRLRDALGTRVRLVGTGSRGKIEIEYYSLDELDGLLTVIENTRPRAESIEMPSQRRSGTSGRAASRA